MSAAAILSRIGAALAAALIALAVWWWLAPPDVLARGFLLAFALWCGFPLGSLALVMIHTLTAGRWGDRLAPLLRAGALLVPLAALAFVPIALTLPALYPWAAVPGSIPHDVQAHYLNVPFFLVRAAVALVGWSVLGVLFGLGRGNRLIAALGLVFHGLAVSAIAVDWFLSVAPDYVSTAFGMLTAARQILIALAVAAVIAPRRLGRGTSDLAGLVMMGVLGVVYLELMSFIVAWYGDLPYKAAWYLDRSGGWGIAIGVAAALAVAALAMLTSASVRETTAGLRTAGALVLGALAIHTVWLIAPSWPDAPATLVPATLVPAALGLAVLVLASLAVVVVPAHDAVLDDEEPRREAERPLGLAAFLALSAASIAVYFRARPEETAPASREAEQEEHEDHEEAPTDEMTDRATPESPAIAGRPVLVTLFGFFAFVAVCLIGGYVYLFQVMGGYVASPAVHPAPPRLQISPTEDLDRFLAAQRATLDGYAWVDRDRGIARIPIDEAMRAITARGADAYRALEQPEITPTPGSRAGDDR
ncbi:hypothetical protein A33M_1945 [Rhodovulum sp. PH10]|uniref:hypothetical protein n=1 Tax=Rhodovulum sp. PH10 TaxID=1187851 RepID=UPI00027C2B00|nr:hypothetical protein [Rhodovulum sp. PH10]EJW12529.1 hypothetical protein A33M_1945 [Rhodovulum sp. PH10]